MPTTNRRTLAIAAITAAIVLVAGAAAAFALTNPVRTQSVAGVPQLATGLPLTEQPAPAPSRGASAGQAPVGSSPKSTNPASAAAGAQNGPSTGSGTSRPKGGSAGSGSASKGSASSGSADDHHGDDDSDDHETVKPKVRDEHSDGDHD